MTRRDLLTALVSTVVGVGAGAGTVTLTRGTSPTAAPTPLASAADMKIADDNPGPKMGIVESVGYYSPSSGQESPLIVWLNDGVDKRWPVTIYAWRVNAEITWNAAPVFPDDLAGYLIRHQASVIYWPLPSLGGNPIKADFSERK